MRAKLVERARTANSAAGEQHETVAHALGISQLMNGEKERAPARSDVANELHHFAGLPEIEPVEGLIQQEQGMRRDQRERQHQASTIAFRQGKHALSQYRPQSDVANDFCDVAFLPLIGSSKEFNDSADVLIVPWSHPVGQIEHDLPPMRERQRCSSPDEAAGVGREHASNRLEERSLAGSVRPDQTEDLACMHLEGHLRECRLIAVALA